MQLRGHSRSCHELLARGLVVLLCAGFFPAQSSPAAEDQAVDPIAEKWGVPAQFDIAEKREIRSSWARRITGYLTVRDGTRLRYSALLPKGKGPFPVIVNYSGYDPGAIGGPAYRHNDTAMSTSLDHDLLEHGYAVVGVNARGTGCSEGAFAFLARDYGLDGADIVEWAAQQAWSNGAVGTANWSWAGMSQLATASERPAHLKAIAPGMVLTDPRSDSWAIGGVPSQGFVTGWWQYLHSRWLSVRHSAEAEGDTQCLARVDQNFEDGEKRENNLPTLLIQHPLRDAVIDARRIYDRVDRIQVPVLSMEAFQDEATTVRANYFHDLLEPSKLWLVQTNGNHDLYESLEFRTTLIAFFDRFVKGVPNGFEAHPHVEIWFETDSPKEDGHARDKLAKPRWRVIREAFPVTGEQWVLNIGNDHSLGQEVPANSPPDAYAYPIKGATINVIPGRGEWGALPAGWREGSAVYTSKPLSDSTVIHGSVSADLWISSSASDTDLQVTLTELRLDGQEQFIQRGWLRVSNRMIDENRSTPTRPILRDRPEFLQALVPDRPVLARVELSKVAHAFRPGSRVRVWIDAPSATGENDFDHSSLPARNLIWHDTEHPSRLVFTRLTGVQVPPEPAKCGHVLMQPCRPDPLSN